MAMIISFDFPHSYDVDVEGVSDRDVRVLAFSGVTSRVYDKPFEIRVVPHAAPAWVGHFVPGYASPPAVSAVLSCPNPSDICVVSEGQAFFVNVERPTEWAVISAIFPVTDARAVPHRQMILFADFTEIAAYRSYTPLWETERLSWDGIEILEITDDEVRGLAWSAPEDRQVPFTVDLGSGQHEGGARPGFG